MLPNVSADYGDERGVSIKITPKHAILIRIFPRHSDKGITFFVASFLLLVCLIVAWITSLRFYYY